MSEKEYTPKNILSLLAVGAIMVGGIALVTGCEEDLRTPEQKLAETPVPEFKPYHREFKLADGTRCVMFSTPMATSRRAGSSGVSCDWEKSE